MIATPPISLTPEQRRIVEWGDGPLVVIAGAGTGKTRVIVERVKYLLETRPDLVPEQILVLTYNVKATRELQDRLGQAVGAAVSAHMTVSNFHSFCHRVLTESSAEAGVPANPDLLDGIGQYLLLRDIRPQLPLIYHTDWALAEFVKLINRAKDELVTPADFEAFVAHEQTVFEHRYGSYDEAALRLATQGNLKGPRDVRKAYAGVRRAERAQEAGSTPTYDASRPAKEADREARRIVGGTGGALRRTQIPVELHADIDALAASYVVDGAALEMMRLHELAAVYRAYQTELVARGALDFGELIAAVTQLFKVRPNLLRRWQRQFRYVLVDEFQDANIAQIELIEMLGRTPDRPDNVMVVGDDDQSIYRFRGASYAAFSEFDLRFARPPVHEPGGLPPGPPPRLRIDQNFRSVGHVLSAANRLIEHNGARFAPDKRMWTDREPGYPVRLISCAGPEDEAVTVVDAIRACVDPEQPRWSDVAVLYRKHKHREAIVARLRDEDIPYTVVGGLSLFATPEIRDLEQSLRAIADPQDDIALMRMLTAGPWRLDALEILRITRMARFDRRHIIEAVRDIVTTGDLEVAVVAVAPEGPDAPASPEAQAELQTVIAAPTMRAKLRRLLGILDELQPRTWREGPFTLLDRLLELSGQVLDLIATDTTDAHRTVVNIASFLRFAADWQQAHASGTLSGFVDYLDAYQMAGGELPTSVELTEDVEGVRLMTLYQAKGLEFRHVFVPSLLESQWPTKEGWSGYFPTELLREQTPGGDIHLDEERRLLYVAMTRAQDRLTLTTHSGPSVSKGQSLFVGELLDGAGEDLQYVDRVGTGSDTAEAVDAADGALGALERSTTLIRQVMPLPSKRERRLALRLRATELVGLLEGMDAADPESAAARAGFEAGLASVGHAAAVGAEQARALGLDPLTFREVAHDSGAGANLLQVASLPRTFSYSSFDTYDRCPMRYAFQYVYQMPRPETPVAAFAFGSTAHAAFEAFTRERRERAARGDPSPTRADLEREFRTRWTPTEFGDRPTEERYQRRVASLLDNFWTGEVSNLGEAIAEEQGFELTLEPADGSAPVVIIGSIDRIDRLRSGAVEVIDYKTGNISSQKGVDQSLQLSVYALACRDALGLGTPERVTLYFTESATRMSTIRTDEQLDAARDEILARVARMRSGDFVATPGEICRWCDFARMCPSKA